MREKTDHCTATRGAGKEEENDTLKQLLNSFLVVIRAEGLSLATFLRLNRRDTCFMVIAHLQNLYSKSNEDTAECEEET